MSFSQRFLRAALLVILWLPVLPARAQAETPAPPLPVEGEAMGRLRLALPLVLYGSTGAAGAVEVPSTWRVTPAFDLQAALNQASEGDVISFAPGVYTQSAQINKRLTLQAEQPGRAVLSGASPADLAYKAVPSIPGLYVASVGWPVWWVSAAGRLLLDYTDLDNLNSFTFPDTGTPGPQEGFIYDSQAKKMYVRLSGGADPNAVQPQINRRDSYERPGLKINASGVTVDGLVFRHWYAAGVQIETPHQGVTVRNCLFEGNKIGVSTAGYSADHKDIFIFNNEFSSYPVYELRRQGTYDVWRGLYNSNLNTAGIHAYTNGITIQHNYLYELFDGIQALGWKGLQDPSPAPSDVSYNVIQNIVDNPLEFDPVNSSLDMRAHHNFVFDAHVLVSMTSFQHGQILVDHNIFWGSADYGIYSTWFKTKLNKEAEPDQPAANLTLAHNTVLLRHHGSGLGSSLYINGSEQATYANSKLQNNIILVREISSTHDYQLNEQGFWLLNENILFGEDVPGTVLPNALHAEPGFQSLAPRVDFRLRPDGAAVGAGENHDLEYHHITLGGATDLGAIEYGDEWTMPRPGPAWGNPQSIPGRPPLPAALDPAFVGLAP